MTCRYTNTDWRDALYNAVRKTEGGVVDAARYLSERRDISIHPESLRKKLRGVPGESMDVEMAVLLTEWMQGRNPGAEYAQDWLLTLNAQEGLCVDAVPPAPEGGWADEAAALQSKFLAISTKLGKIAGVTARTVADGVIDQTEADELIPLVRAARVILHRMERNALRAARGQK